MVYPRDFSEVFCFFGSHFFQDSFIFKPLLPLRIPKQVDIHEAIEVDIPQIAFPPYERTPFLSVSP